MSPLKPLSRKWCSGLPCLPWCRTKVKPIEEKVEPPTRPTSILPRSASNTTAVSLVQDPRFITCEIWEAAYDALKNDAKLRPLVENYEEFFNTLLWPNPRRASTEDNTGSAEQTPRRRAVTIVNNPALSATKEPSNLQLTSDDIASSSKEEPGQDSRAYVEMSERRFRTAAQLYSKITEPYDRASGIASSAIQFIGRIKVAVDAVLASSPPASMAWAGVCLVVLPIVLNHSEQIAAKQSGFNYVMSRFYWYDQVLSLLDRDHWKNHRDFVSLRYNIREEIINLYKLLIEYQLRAYYAYCRPMATITRDIFKLDDWDGMILNIKEAEERLQEYMDLNFEQHVLDGLHCLAEDARRRQRAEMALKFKFPDELPYDVYQSYVNGISPLHQGTGYGVTSHPSFLSWANASNGLLLLSGIPGSGKSVLAKSMIHSLPLRRPTTVCSFFFNDSVSGQDLATTALCRILDEVFAAQISLIDRVIPRIEHLLPQEIRSNLDLLWSILVEATAETTPGEFTIVLDAIDECVPDHAIDLCRMINSYLDSPSARLKFFITTRPVALFGQPFDASTVNVVQTNEDSHCLQCIGSDIEKVVASRFDEFARVCIEDPGLRRELSDLIQPRGERTYLYIKLIFDYLDAKIKSGLPRVPHAWVQVFKKLPTTVREAYSEFLADVRESHREDVRLMLQMVVAAARPLTVREINIALNIRDQKWGSPRGLGLQAQNSFQHWILDACRCLLDVHNGRVYFIHKTARDYLLAGQRGRSSPPDWLGSFTIESCHAALAESCLAYLCLPLVSAGKFASAVSALGGQDPADDDDDDYHRWTVQELDFSNYASVYYRTHLTGSNTLAGANSVLPVRISKSLAVVRSWSKGFVTTVRPNFPPDLVGLIDYDQIDDLLQPEHGYGPTPERGRYLSDAEGQGGEPETFGLQIILTVADKKVVFTTIDGEPIPRILRIPTTSNSLLERATNSLYTISLFRSVSAIAGYQEFSPIPSDWFSVRITGASSNRDGSRQTTVVDLLLGEKGSLIGPAIMNLGHGDTLSYVLTNKTRSIPVSAHLLCLSSSWSIQSPIWNEPILPGQEKCGSLAMIVPSKVNESDSETVEDEFLVIFVVGEQHSGRNGWDNLEDWLNIVYMPPILPPSLSELGEIKRPWRAGVGSGVGWSLPFVPPPNWQVWRFNVTTTRSFPRGRATI
ncbi:hypothetical protein V8F20_009234 [Naviculisporaceae sp. PSN 640]